MINTLPSAAETAQGYFTAPNNVFLILKQTKSFNDINASTKPQLHA
jgi:hypothetical protein